MPSLLWLILGLGLFIKILYLVFSRQSPFYEPLLLDPAYYHQWALKILGGDFVGDPVFYGLPLYPFFVALCYKLFAGSIFAVKLVQALLGTVTLFLTYKIGEKLSSKKVGLIAALLAAFYGPLFFHEQIFIPEALSLPLYAGSFYACCLFMDQPSIKKGLILGGLFGLAALTKAGILLFIPVFFIAALVKETRSTRKWFLPLGVCLVTFLLILAPVWLHNRVYGKDRVFLTSHSGFNFYIGNNPESEGVFMAPEGTGSNVEAQIEDSKAIAEKALGKNLKASEVSRYWSERAWEFIRQNPSKFLKLCVRKALLFFSVDEISDVDDYLFGKNFNPILKFPWLGFSVLGPLIILGFVVSMKTIRYRLLTVAWIVSYLLGMIAFFINARYRLPILSIFFVIAGMAVLDLLNQIKRRAWPQASYYCLVLALGVWVTQLHLVGTDWTRDYVNAGDAYQEKKDFERATLLYQKALEIDPNSYKANLAMGIVQTKLGHDDQAKEFYSRSLAANPNNAQAYNNLGLWYDRQGDLEKARDYFMRAIEIKPNSSQAHNNLGMIYGKVGDHPKAVEEFKVSLNLNPRSARAYTNLGLIYYRLKELDKAEDCWRKALQIDPNFPEAKRAVSLLHKEF